jgi:protein-tyrosine-phosphatase
VSDGEVGVVEAMAELGLDISKEFLKPLTDDAVKASDVVITMGCGDECLYFPGEKYLGWELDDQSSARGLGLDERRVPRELPEPDAVVQPARLGMPRRTQDPA